MKPPGIFDYLFGNPVSVALLSFWAASTGYGWLAQGAHPLAFGVALFLAGLSINSAKQLRAFKQWNKAWTNAGALPKEPKSRQPKKATWVSLGILALVFAFAWLSDHPHDSSGASGAAVLIIISVFAWMGDAAWRGLRRMQAKRRPNHAGQAGQEIVTVCLPIPKQSPAANKSLLLPDYCLPLLARSSNAEGKGPRP
jgi:hypothetical protein